MADTENDRIEADALAMWQELERNLKARGWFLSVGCGYVHICIPGDGGPMTDRYVEVVDG